MHIQTTAVAASHSRRDGSADNFCNRLRAINAINEAILELKAVEQGPHKRIPRGTMERVLEELRVNAGVTVSRDYLYYRKCKLDAGPVLSITVPTDHATVSRLSVSDSYASSSDDVISTKARGRPVGTTLKAKVAKRKARSACVNEITKEYLKQLDVAKKKKRTSPGFLTELIDNKWEEHGLNEYDGCQHSRVIKETIRNRANTCKDPFALHRGTSSPLALIEEAICEILIQMGRIRQPLSVTESINLANSLIKGSEISNTLIEF